MTVGSTVVKPGQATNFIFPYSMHPGMGGKHHFEVHVRTNDPVRSNLVFHIYANSLEPKASTPNGEGYYTASVATLRTAMKQKNFALVNVHIPFEGRIPGTDLEVAYDQIDQALGKLPQDKSAPIVLYCRSGRMSEIAAVRLAQLGYTQVVSLNGGMVAWEAAGYPIEAN